MLILTLFINLDSYKFRIIFNYLNFHINSGGIFLHIITLILFIYLIYYFIYNIDKSIGEKRIGNELSEIERLRLIYKLEVITLIIFLFTSVIDYLM